MMRISCRLTPIGALWAAGMLASCAQGSGDGGGGDAGMRDAAARVDARSVEDAQMADQGPIDGGPPCTIDAECNDGIGCTVDTCDPVDGCVNLVDDTACDDELVCNGVETCDGSGVTAGDGCMAGAPVDCDDGDPCSTDLCEEPTGTCMHAGSDADGDGVAALGCASGTDCDDTNPDVYPGAMETCNAVDDDCNGAPDDGFTCAMGSTASCTTACGSSGLLTCNAGCDGFGACVGIEVCNGCDDDGAAGPDDTFPCVQGETSSCTTSCGTPGNQVCNATCTGYGSCLGSEICGNGCDDDGDGMIDEDCTVPPPNDTCPTAITLSGANGTRSDAFDSATATTTGCGAGGEIWYTITLSAPTIVYIDSFGSSFDTRLSLRTGCGGAMLQCDDDHCGTAQEQLARELPAGTHHIAVHAALAGTTTGTVSLRWQTLGVVGGDNIRITGNGTYTGSTSGSSTYSASCAGSGPEDMFFFTVCPSTTRSATGSTCSGTAFDTVLSFRSSSGEVSCNDDACSLQSTTTASLAGPGVFGLVVDGWGSDSGSYSVAVSGL